MVGQGSLVRTRTTAVLVCRRTSSAENDGVARGPMVLREEGLIDATRRDADVRLRGRLPSPIRRRSVTRDPIIDLHGLGELMARVRDPVARFWTAVSSRWSSAGHCPLLSDASVVGMRSRVGLLVVDGHEDAPFPSNPPPARAEDVELVFALAMADASWSTELAAVLPLLEPADVPDPRPTQRGAPARRRRPVAR